MKSMILDKPMDAGRNPLAPRDIPMPVLQSREILVRVNVCGVCRTDLHIVEGEIPLPVFPIVPGHQIIGIIEQTAPDVTRFKTGDRVGIAWLHDTCEHCDFCKTGRENLCENAHFTGLHINGGYAQYTVVREDFAFAVPPAYSDEKSAPLMCAGIIGWRSMKISRIQPGQRLGMYGFGASAHITMQIAIAQGIEVYVMTRTEEHRQLARKLGAAWVGDASEVPSPMDSSIIFAPSGKLLPMALEKLQRGGTVSLAGIYMTAIPEMDYQKHLYYEKTIVSATNYTRQDAQELMDIAARHHIETHTQLLPLAEANRALQMLKRSELEASAVLQVRNQRAGNLSGCQPTKS